MRAFSINDVFTFVLLNLVHNKAHGFINPDLRLHKFRYSSAIITTKSSIIRIDSPSPRGNNTLEGKDTQENVIDQSDYEMFASVGENLESSNDQKEVIDEINWRVKKVALEEAHTRSFLKAKPRKLPYEDARRWVQANLGADTKEEFYDLVANGNLRTPYIPKQPEKYYKDQGTWISWNHFLHGLFDNQLISDDKENES